MTLLYVFCYLLDDGLVHIVRVVVRIEVVYRRVALYVQRLASIGIVESRVLHVCHERPRLVISVASYRANYNLHVSIFKERISAE